MQRQLEQIIVAATLAFLLGCHAGLGYTADRQQQHLSLSPKTGRTTSTSRGTGMSLTPQMFDTLMKKIQRTVDFFRILD